MNREISRGKRRLHPLKNKLHDPSDEWVDVIENYYALPKSRQDEIMFRIYQRVYKVNTPKHFSLLLSAKSYA